MSRRLSILLLLLVFAVSACEDTTIEWYNGDELIDGDDSETELPDGDIPDGDVPDTDGDIPDGDVPYLDGDVEQTPDGDDSDGDNVIPDGDDDIIEPPDGDADAEFDPNDYPIEDVETSWFSCSLYEGENDGRAECSSTAMPLFWDNGYPEHSGETMNVYAKRLPSPTGEGKTQVWLLHGGPGASGVYDFPPMMESIQQNYPEADIYTIDHRGVGYSERLNCPEQEHPDSEYGKDLSWAELEDCVDYLEEMYGDGLNAFSTSYSAIDVAAYIHATRKPDVPVIVWGGSYGTYIGHRYMQIFPNQADAVVLEGIVDPTGSFITTQAGRDFAGRALLETCAEDFFCSAKLEGDPIGFLERLYDRLDNGHCSDLGVTKETASYMMGLLMYYHPLNSVIPAFIYRLDRCSNDDMYAIYNMYQTLFHGSGDFFDFDESFSQVLSIHVAYSEMWLPTDIQDRESIDAYCAEVDATALFGSSCEGEYELYDFWPRYEDRHWDDRWAETDIPLLMLQGYLDPATPWNEAIIFEEHFRADLQYFNTFNYSPHNVTGGSPMASDPEESDCGDLLFTSFLKNPYMPLDRSCLDDLLPTRFEGSRYLSEYIFGTRDFWERGRMSEPFLDASKMDRLHRRLKPLLRDVQRKHKSSSYRNPNLFRAMKIRQPR